MIKNKKGFTIIESVVAMLLVAIVVGGVFAALMAARRGITEPGYKEDMVYAVESVNNLLKLNVSGAAANGAGVGPCTIASNALSSGEKSVACMIPQDACGPGSTFTYTVADDYVIEDTYNNHLNDFTLKRVIVSLNCRRDTL